MSDELLLRRFFAKVDKRTDGCWFWKGCLTSGYGVIAVNGKVVKAHRLSYELFKGPVLPGFDVCHSCHNRQCVAPDHLSAGSRADNMRDMVLAGRHRNGILDPEIHSEVMRRAWARHSPRERSERIYNVSRALKGKSFTEEHLANLRASPANQKGRPPRAFGPQLPRTALTAEQVLIIRQKYADGVKQEELGREFGIGREAISNLLRGISYRWVKGGPTERLAGYGTQKKSDYSVHGNTGRKRSEELKAAHSARMKELYAQRKQESDDDDAKSPG